MLHTVFRFTLTKKPDQNGQYCLTRAVEVKAMLVKEKARTMAPRPRWHSPRYRSTLAPPGPRPDMPLRLSDQPRDPEAEATLLESDGEGMLDSSLRRRRRRLGEVSRSLWVHKTKFSCCVWAEARESRRGRDINAGFRTPLRHNYAPSSPLAGAIGAAQCPMVCTIVQSVSPRTLSAES